MQSVRQTRQRQSILETVRATPSHPDASWVFDQVRQSLPNISLGTVYRGLDVLVEQGQLIRIYAAGDAVRYDAPKPNHHHLICTGCGTIVDLTLDAQDLAVLGRHLPPGSTLDDMTLLLRGHCVACQV